VQDNHPPLAASDLEHELQREFGTLLPSQVLVRVLGYPTPEAFRKALSLKRLPIPVFQIPGRRGHFALCKDVAQWLTSSRNAAAAPVRSNESDDA
jgi:hypothetical protein